MRSSLRPLLPAIKSNAPSIESYQTGPIPRPPKTATACKACRKRKVKCDGRHPVCTSCQSRYLRCEWILRDRPEDLIGRLRQLPYRDAVALLQEIRASPKDHASMSATMHIVDLSEQQSDPSALPEGLLMRSLLTSTPGDLEFELAVRHSVAYPPVPPIQIDPGQYTRLLRPRKVVTSTLSTYKSFTATPAESASDFEDIPRSEILGEKLIDDRLKLISIDKWTKVPISDQLAASIISLYLEIDYPVLPVFDADLFLDALVDQSPYFCSRLLVSALMSWACQAYTALLPEAAALVVAFCLESEELLSEEKRLNTLTTVSALQLLSMTAMTQGRDNVALRYLRQGVQIGKLMGLFGVDSQTASAETWLSGFNDWQRAASYTAWGVFNRVSIYGLHYRKMEVEVPPLLPVPVHDNKSMDADANGDNRRVIYAHVFAASCSLWTIFHSVLLTYYNREGSEDTPISLTFAENVYRRLLTWASTLPLDLVRTAESSHPVMMMHMYFHAIVADLFRPFLGRKNKNLQLDSFEAPRASPKAAYHASINQLKRLVLLYRLAFDEPTLSVLWQTGLIYVANATISESRSSESTEWRFYMQMCLSGLDDLHRSFRVSRFIAEGLLGMAMRLRAISVTEAQAVAEKIRSIARIHSETASLEEGEDVVANWIVDLNLALSDPNAARGTAQVLEFQKLVPLEEDE